MPSNYDLHALLIEIIAKNFLGKTLMLIMSRINDVEDALSQPKSTWYGTDPSTGTYYGSPVQSNFPHMRITYTGSATLLYLRDRIDELRTICGIAAFPWVYTPAYSDYTSNSWKACIDTRQLLEMLQAIGRIVPDVVGFKFYKKKWFWAAQDSSQGINDARWQTGDQYGYAQQVYAFPTGAINRVFQLDACAYVYPSQKRIKMVDWGDYFLYPASAFHTEDTGIAADPGLESSKNFWVSYYDAVERREYTPREYGVADSAEWWEPDIKPELFKGVGFWVNIYKRSTDAGDADLDWLETIGDNLGILLQVTLGEATTEPNPSTVNAVDGTKVVVDLTSNTIVYKWINKTKNNAFTIQGHVCTHHDEPPLITVSDVDLITGYQDYGWVIHTLPDLCEPGVISPDNLVIPDEDIDVVNTEDPVSVNVNDVVEVDSELTCRSSDTEPNSLDDLMNATVSAEGEYFWYLPEDGVDQYYDWVEQASDSGYLKQIFNEYDKVNKDRLLEELGEVPDVSDLYQFPAVPRAAIGDTLSCGQCDFGHGQRYSGSADGEMDSKESYYVRQIAYTGGLTVNTSSGSKWIVWSEGYIPITQGWPDVLKPSEE